MVAVVTGASGFLGSVLVSQLLDAGRSVRGVDLAPRPDGLDIDWVRADVGDREALRRAFAGADTVFHLAALISVTGDPGGRVWATNVDGAATSAAAAIDAGVGRFVHCSSVHAFDLEAVDHIDEASPRAVAPHLPVYDRSKAAGERAVQAAVERGLDAVIVNPTGVIGPFDFERSRMSRVFLALMRRRLPALVHGGFDWVDVRDVARSLLAAEERGTSGEGYLLPGKHASLGELADCVAEVSGTPAPPITVPIWLAKAGSPFATFMSRTTGSPLWSTSESLHALEFSPPVSGRKASAELGHVARPLRETIVDIHSESIRQGLLGKAL